MLYQLAHWLKDKLPLIWDTIEKMNERLFVLRYGRKMKSIHVTCVPEGYKLVALEDVDVARIADFFVHQPKDAFAFFKPHGFDTKSIKRLQKNLT